MKLIWTIAIAALFLALRLPGVDLPYHQDEWKNVATSETVEGAGAFFAHPPLMQMIFVADHRVFGPDGFRILPLVFSIGSVVLLYAIVRRRAGRAAGVWAAVLFSVCFYAVFGSLQADVDGSILPFFFLLAVLAYDKAGDLAVDKRRRAAWFTIMALALLAGMLVKLNFILAVGAIGLHFLWSGRRDKPWKRAALGAGALVVFGAVYVGLLYAIQYAYPAFSISFMLEHAGQFSEDISRNWTQIAVQGIKALYYLSPLLIVPLVFISKETLKKSGIFVAYMLLGLIFYFAIFDFSRGALDKYLMFSIVPLAAISGIVIADAMTKRAGKMGMALLLGLVGSGILLALNLLPDEVAALYPKEEWFGRVLSGQWNVLAPLTGGSGPTGFYVSFLFIAASYIAAALAALAGLIKKDWRPQALFIVVLIGVSYNLVFAEELFYGKINGSSREVLVDTTDFIASSPSISQVITYNDIGSGELSRMGKYAGRFYAAPQFEEGHKDRFANFRGYYMIVDIPHLYEDSFYGQFFSGCFPVYRTASGAISGTVYECPS